MADLSITAANVVKGTGAVVESGYVAGEAITAGQLVYLDSANKWKLSDLDSGTAALRTVGGIALNGASLNQPISVQTSGEINPGATVTVGKIYVGSGTAGGITPVDEIASGDYVSIVGVGLTASSLSLRIYNSGVVVPA